MTKDTIRNGEISEQICQHKCFVEHGYMVSKPVATADYDLIVEVDNRPLRVQVKSTQKSTEVLICKGTNGQGNKGKGKYAYPENSIDFFVIHDKLLEEWFIVPRSATGDAKKIRFSSNPNTKYAKYLDNWEFIK
tara:strand:+ start:545 stop:946 length:402 start_codon:yes stop_codon:yes gene_type:complete